MFNINALYKELRKKLPTVPYTRIAASIDGSPSNMNEKEAKALIEIIRRAAKDAEENVTKSIKS